MANIAAVAAPPDRPGLGLYALKPWYAARLAPVRRRLAARGTSPATVTWIGVAAGAGAGVVFATVAPGVVAGTAVAALLVARLGCANLDGALARETGNTTPLGAVVNELGDRLAELAALAGLLFVAPAWLVLCAAFAVSAPSWVALAGASAGATRVQGGPVGKTERTALLIAAAALGHVELVLAVMSVGSLLTAARRFVVVRRQLSAAGR